MDAGPPWRIAAAQPAGEIVHEGGRRVLHRSEVDVARRLAARAPDLQPGVSSIHGLVDSAREVDSSADRMAVVSGRQKERERRQQAVGKVQAALDKAE